MLVYSQNGVHIEQVAPFQFVISSDNYGQMILINLPNDGQIMLNTKFLEGMAKGVAMRTGKNINKKAN